MRDGFLDAFEQLQRPRLKLGALFGVCLAGMIAFLDGIFDCRQLVLDLVQCFQKLAVAGGLRVISAHESGDDKFA
jgi:hypothetical protein